MSPALNPTHILLINFLSARRASKILKTNSSIKYFLVEYVQLITIEVQYQNFHSPKFVTTFFKKYLTPLFEHLAHKIPSTPQKMIYIYIKIEFRVCLCRCVVHVHVDGLLNGLSKILRGTQCTVNRQLYGYRLILYL